MVHLLKSVNQHWYISIYQSPRFVQMPSGFVQCPFLPSRCHTARSCHTLLGSSWLGRFCSHSLFFMTLAVLKSAGQVFCRTLLYWNLMFFSWLDGGLWARGGNHRGEVPFSSQHIQGADYQHGLLLLILTPIACWGCVCQVFSLQSYSFFLITSILYSLEGRHYAQPTLKKWEAVFPLLEDGVST